MGFNSGFKGLKTRTALHVSDITMPITRSPSNCRCSLWFPYECEPPHTSNCRCSLWFPYECEPPHPSNCRCSLWFPYECEPPHSYGNQRLQRQFDGLLMMGMVMPETCWAVSVRQSNKFYDWLLHLVGCFYLSDWRCTEPQTLNVASCCLIYLNRMMMHGLTKVKFYFRV